MSGVKKACLSVYAFLLLFCFSRLSVILFLPSEYYPVSYVCQSMLALVSPVRPAHWFLFGLVVTQLFLRANLVHARSGLPGAAGPLLLFRPGRYPVVPVLVPPTALAIGGLDSSSS